ncbi:MAG: hypothetical protein MJ252_20690 [archaeon]|nr:hypothetical protein [archaeon]
MSHCPCCEENMSILMNLLQKVEQILSILNLSDPVVSKYNQLKKLTYERLNLPFTPLIKQPSPKMGYESLFRTVFLQGMKKQILIEIMLEYISKQPQEIQSYLNQLNSVFNIDFNALNGKSIDDFEFETKKYEEKIKDDFCRFDELMRNKLDLLKTISDNYEQQLKSNQSTFEKEIYTLKEQLDKNSNIEKDLYDLRKKNDEDTYLIETLNKMIANTFDKYNTPQNPLTLSQGPENDCTPIISQLRKILNLMDKFYDDNKYLSDTLPKLQKEKLELNTELNLPYVSGVVNKNGMMQDLVLDMAEVEKSSQTFHKNFDELINYIATNIESNLD